ncbi:MAG: sulfur carrier protein ThiS [Methylobacteriaceae bacterium]|nr:sulfur carrier protein ThiS [Methylobacteriaceae bacterium]
MVLRVNGEPREVRAETVAGLLDELGYEGGFFAVAVNAAVIRRTTWDEAKLSDGDEIEIVTPRQGG